MSASLPDAQWHEQRGELAEALGVYDQLLRSGDVDTDTLIRKGLLHRQLGEIAQAIAALEQAQRLAPDDPYPTMRLGQIAQDVGRPLAAAGFMRRAAQTAASTDRVHQLQEMKVNLAAAYTGLRQLDLARAVARTLPEGLPDWWAGAREKALSDHGDARATLSALIKRRGGGHVGPDLWLELARALLALGRLRSARAITQALMQANPHWDLLRYFMADIVTREAGPAEALVALRAPPHLARASTEFMGSEIRLLQELGRWNEILDRLAEDPTVRPFPHVRYAAVTAMSLLERWEDLRALCHNWMQEEPLALPPAAFLLFLSTRRAASPRPLEVSPAAKPVQLMQFWNTSDIPADVREVMASWLRRHPHWSHVTFDDDGARAFFASHLASDAVAALDHCFHPAMKADLFRLGYLFVCGGVYADADEACLKPMDAIVAGVSSAELVAPLAGDFPGYVDNFFIGARAGSVIIQTVLQDAVENILAAAQQGRRPDIWQTTGPGALTRGVGRYVGGDPCAGTVSLLPAQQYRTFARTDASLAYKRNPAANWRIAELT